MPVKPSRVHPTLDKASYTVAQYIVHRVHGLSVLSGYRRFNIADRPYLTMEYRPLENLQHKLSVPLERINAVDMRLPASLEELQCAIDIIAGKDGPGSKRRWGALADGYKMDIMSGSLQSVTKAFASILTKYRVGKSPTGGLYGEIPLSFNISYSERQLAQKALELLSVEFAHGVKWTPEQAREHLLQCALVKDYAKTLKLPARNHVPSHMNETQFKELFGITPKQAGDLDASPVQTVPSRPAVYLPDPREEAARRRGRKISEREEKKPPVKTATGARKHRNPDWSAEYERLVSDEDMHVPIRGSFRGLFVKAQEVLDMSAFRILSQTALRKSESVMSIEQVAHAMKRPVADIIEIRNRSIRTVQSQYGPDKKIARYKSLQLICEDARQSGAAPVNGIEQVKDDVASMRRSREKGLIVESGILQSIFKQAVEILNDDEFDVYTVHRLRQKTHRADIGIIALTRGMERSEVVEIFNRATGKLRAACERAGMNVEKYKAFDPL